MEFPRRPPHTHSHRHHVCKCGRVRTRAPSKHSLLILFKRSRSAHGAGSEPTCKTNQRDLIRYVYKVHPGGMRVACNVRRRRRRRRHTDTFHTYTSARGERAFSWQLERTLRSVRAHGRHFARGTRVRWSGARCPIVSGCWLADGLAGGPPDKTPPLLRRYHPGPVVDNRR